MFTVALSHAFVRIVAVLFLAPSVAWAQYSGATDQPPAGLKAGWDSITEAEVKQSLTFLANECEGRGNGQPGYQKAAAYVAKRLKEWRLQPTGDKGSYYQSVLYRITRFTERGSFVAVLGAGDSIPAGQDLRMTELADAIDITAPVAIIRVQSDRPRIQRGALRGRIVLLESARLDPDLRNEVSGQNPAAILTVVKKPPEAAYDSFRISGAAGPPHRILPRGMISQKAADVIAKSVELPDAAGDAVQLSTIKMHLKADIESQTLDSPNVLAWLPGADPVLKDECVILAAHLDYLGKHGSVIYPGADDGGSGVSALLAVAHAMSMNPDRPKRSILFAFFSGHELQLAGSSWFVSHPVTPLDKIVAEVQLDKVGRASFGPQNGDETRIDAEADNASTLRVVGSRRVPGALDQAIQDANHAVGFKFIEDDEDQLFRTDTYSFLGSQVSVASLFDGFTPDDRQPSDTVDRIDWLKLTSSARLAYLTAIMMAEPQR